MFDWIAGMGRRRFLIYSAAGTAIWTTFLAAGGYLLGEHYRAVGDWTNPVSNAVIAILAGWYLYRVVTFKPAPRG